MPPLDPDGDGISTLMEYRCFWSDPFDANDCGPKLLLVPFGGGAWQASWPTRLGLRYQLEFSPDLVTWLPAGAPVTGTGGVVSRGLDSGAARLFYRLSCPDASLIDADGESVSAVEEGILGTSDLTTVSDPVSGADDYCNAAMLVLAAVVPAPGSGVQTIEVGTPVTGLAHDPITEIPQADALAKNGYFNPPGISAPENWDRFPGAGNWKPLSGDCLELQKSEDPQPWYGQWCELDAHWQKLDRSDHTGPIAHGIEQTIPAVPARRQLFLFFDCCRRHAGAHTGDATKEVTLLTHTAPVGWERVMVPLTLTPPSPLISTQPLCLRFDIGDGLDSYGMYVDNIELIAMDIVPDDNMAGVVGDVVPSAKPASTVKHFVTPKKSADVAQDFVLLKAIALDAVCFGERFARDGGEAGASAEKRKVSRAATDMTPVKIKTQQAAVTAAQMDVWVVWAEFTPSMTGTSQIDGKPLGLASAREDTAEAGPVYHVTGGVEHIGTISPAGVLTAEERPALEKQTPVVPACAGGAARGIAQDDNRDASGSGFSGWDVSRQKSIRTLTGVNLNPVPGGALNGFEPVDYPLDSMLGNDDAANNDEDDNPYAAGKGAVGQLVSKDRPSRLLYDWYPNAAVDFIHEGNPIHFKAWFREYALVQIGAKWYLASDKTPFRFHFFAKRQNNEWHAEPGTADILDFTNDGLPQP